MDPPNPVAGGSSLNQPQNQVQQNQNIVIDPAAQGAAAQLARQILANTNVTLKQEVFKIPEFFGEKTKDTVTAQEFILRIDECQISNDWNDTTTFANFLSSKHTFGFPRRTTGQSCGRTSLNTPKRRQHIRNATLRWKCSTKR